MIENGQITKFYIRNYLTNLKIANFPDQKLKAFDFVEIHNEKKKNEVAVLLLFKQMVIVASL